jgi:hypothetical protein
MGRKKKKYSRLRIWVELENGKTIDLKHYNHKMHHDYFKRQQEQNEQPKTI